ncbi:hypothetical protein [Cedratvirus kamchatka]|uniref:Uncharacterized protein n=1 Tax=Cedratvirus kamchatka TaxID=2716914 RepID=A0A6G8MXW7_9VIRU|nr:hypothetical protein [Cedratvirus kamchatka]
MEKIHNNTRCVFWLRVMRSGLVTENIFSKDLQMTIVRTKRYLTHILLTLSEESKGTLMAMVLSNKIYFRAKVP